MQKLLLLFIIFLSVTTFASKARIQALGNSLHLIDPQTVYSNPIDLISLEDFVAVETGLTAATSVGNGAEAMISYEYRENHRIAVSFGHLDESVVDARNFINVLSSSTFEMPQNPVNVFYAFEDSITSYAFGAFYSKKKDKIAVLSENSAGISVAVEMGNLQFSSMYTFANSAEALVGKKLDGSGYWQTTLSYLLENTKFELQYVTSKAKMSTQLGLIETDNESHSKNVVVLGLADSSVRGGNDFFWGAQVISTTINCKINLSADCNKSFTRTILPAWFGIDAQVNDWMVFRGNVKQSFLISITKDEFGYPASIVNGGMGVSSNVATGENDTVVSSGLGFKFKNMVLDGSLATSTTQKIDLNNFLSQVGLTYNF